MNPVPIRVADLLTAALSAPDQGKAQRHGKLSNGPERVGTDSSDGLTVSTLVDLLGNRSFGIVFVLFGLPNLLPIPGLPMLCGVVIGIVAVQLALGRDHVILPGWLGKRTLSRAVLARLVKRAEPGLRAFERVSRPRWLALTGHIGRRVIGLVAVVLAVTLMAPIPFFGGIPPGLAITLLGLGLAERDGFLTLAGAVVAVGAVAMIGALTVTIARGAFDLAIRLLGV